MESIRVADKNKKKRAALLNHASCPAKKHPGEGHIRTNIATSKSFTRISGDQFKQCETDEANRGHNQLITKPRRNLTE